MPHFKTINIHARKEVLKVSVKISADGQFYCLLSSEYAPAAKSAFSHVEESEQKGTCKVGAQTFEDLKSNLWVMLSAHLEPEVTEVPVIRYNIESHVGFAEDSDGNIYPNAGFPGAEWVERDGRYGDHCAHRAAPGGYSIIVGACAQLKVITKYGDREEVGYKGYYKGGSHHRHDNPAELLNSWSSFDLGRDPKEIPYTDEAALFFHGLMLGMAKLAKQIQSHSFDQAALIRLIESGKGQALLGN
jgi:hypothetical protein